MGSGTSLPDLIWKLNGQAQARVNGTAPAIPIPAAGTTAAGVRKRPPDAPTIGNAISRDEYFKQQMTPTTNPGTPTPPVLPPAVSTLGSAAERMRRRAAAGSAGKVKTGPISGTQAGIQAVTAPRTLIGS